MISIARIKALRAEAEAAASAQLAAADAAYAVKRVEDTKALKLQQEEREARAREAEHRREELERRDPGEQYGPRWMEAIKYAERVLPELADAETGPKLWPYFEHAGAHEIRKIADEFRRAFDDLYAEEAAAAEKAAEEPQEAAGGPNAPEEAQEATEPENGPEEATEPPVPSPAEIKARMDALRAETREANRRKGHRARTD